MEAAYVIYDRRFRRPSLKVITTEGNNISYEKGQLNVLACEFVFFEESIAEKYAKHTWGNDYNDYVLITPLIEKASLDADIELHTKINPKIIERIKKHICDIMNMKMSEIKNTDKFWEDIGMDSLDQITLIMELEKEFNISIRDEDAEKIHCVSDILCYLKNNDLLLS